MSCPEHVSQREFAELFITMFHLVSSFVLIMTQCPASGASALIGNIGRFTARIVSKGTKKDIPIIMETNIPFQTTPGMKLVATGALLAVGCEAHCHSGGYLHFSLTSTETAERSSREKLNGDCPTSRSRRGRERRSQLPRKASLRSKTAVFL